MMTGLVELSLALPGFAKEITPCPPFPSENNLYILDKICNFFNFWILVLLLAHIEKLSGLPCANIF